MSEISVRPGCVDSLAALVSFALRVWPTRRWRSLLGKTRQAGMGERRAEPRSAPAPASFLKGPCLRRWRMRGNGIEELDRTTAAKPRLPFGTYCCVINDASPSLADSQEKLRDGGEQVSDSVDEGDDFDGGHGFLPFRPARDCARNEAGRADRTSSPNTGRMI